MKDVEAFAKTHPNFNLSSTTTVVGFISQETGVDRGTLRYAQYGGVDSIRVICKLAGFAGLYLDEYRKDE
jgi:hypothetical protein